MRFFDDLPLNEDEKAALKVAAGVVGIALGADPQTRHAAHDLFAEGARRFARPADKLDGFQPPHVGDGGF